MDELQEQVNTVKSDIGVYVNSSSMGALEALIGYLRNTNTLV